MPRKNRQGVILININYHWRDKKKKDLGQRQGILSSSLQFLHLQPHTQTPTTFFIKKQVILKSKQTSSIQRSNTHWKGSNSNEERNCMRMSTESEYLNHNGHLSFQGPPWKLHGRTHLSHTNSVILPSPEKRANKNAYPWTYLTKRDQLSDANLLPFFQIIKHQYNKKKGNFLIYKKKKK